MLISWILKPAYEGFARRKGEIVAELASTRELEELKALGRRDVDQQNETHKAKLAGRNSMRAASVEKRLEVHQAAFALWWELRNAVHAEPETLLQCVQRCQSWWVENCLYLAPNAREDFSLAYASASIHRNYLASPANNENDRKALQENWARIMAPGESLLAAVELPPIAEDLRNPADSSIGSNVELPRHN